MSLNNQTVDLPEACVHPCYRLETWRKVYSYIINPIGGRLYWLKCNVPTTLLPLEHQPQAGTLKIERSKSKKETYVVKIAKSGKISMEHKTVTCDKCRSKGNNSRTCTGPRYLFYWKGVAVDDGSKKKKCDDKKEIYGKVVGLGKD
ncbi:hypothetical protein Tco_1090387 [Tanacetum coccineum]|uniref:Uncharacterized protein n=1 Tax=Tanacetum coccineum TaxID=301880 RepID=A0ABQ5I411_9ASTR